MLVSRDAVAALQFFLLDAAKRSALADASDLLANAAALDYALFVSSERPGDVLADTSPVAGSLRETLTSAAVAALAFAASMLHASEAVRAEFADRHLRAGGILDVLRALRACGALRGDDVAFRLIAISHDFSVRDA